MKEINSFDGEYRFLSNFWLCPISRADFIYPSTENAYQSAKVKNKVDRYQFLNCSPALSKRIIHENPNNIILNQDFDKIKLDVMDKILQFKFRKGSWERYLLDGTKGYELIEGNSWGDVFWGVCDGVGENNLGKLLMNIRAS